MVLQVDKKKDIGLLVCASIILYRGIQHLHLILNTVCNFMFFKNKSRLKHEIIIISRYIRYRYSGVPTES